MTDKPDSFISALKKFANEGGIAKDAVPGNFINIDFTDNRRKVVLTTVIANEPLAQIVFGPAQIDEFVRLLEMVRKELP